MDSLVEIIAGRLDGKGGARMTGGGFGGCVVVLAPTTLVADIKHVVSAQYPSVSGLIPELMKHGLQPVLACCSGFNRSP